MSLLWPDREYEYFQGALGRWLYENRTDQAPPRPAAGSVYMDTSHVIHVWHDGAWRAPGRQNRNVSVMELTEKS